jgi:hypothetical protein
MYNIPSNISVINIKIINNMITEIRKFKIRRIIEKDIEFTYSRYNLSTAYYSAIKKLSKQYNVILTGGVLLKMAGLLFMKRIPNDIDVLLTQEEFDKIAAKHTLYHNRYHHIPDVNCKGYILYFGVLIDLFVISQEEFNKRTIRYNNIILDDIFAAIEAKVNITNIDRDKDFMDFISITEVLASNKFYHTQRKGIRYYFSFIKSLIQS